MTVWCERGEAKAVYQTTLPSFFAASMTEASSSWAADGDRAQMKIAAPIASPFKRARETAAAGRTRASETDGQWRFRTASLI